MYQLTSVTASKEAMKLLFVFLPFWAATIQAAAVSYLVAPTKLISYPQVRTSIVTPNQYQYHNQDALGQYSYGYSEPLSSKQEVRSLDGITRGSYSYQDSDGIIQTVDYRADDSGFHVAATNLPKAVQSFRSSPAAAAGSASIQSNSVSATNTDSESVESAGENGNAVYPSSWLPLAKHSTANTKSLADSANVRNVELYKSLENTIGVAPAHTVFLKKQPIAVATTIPLAKTYLPKVYSYGYPFSTTHYLANGLYY